MIISVKYELNGVKKSFSALLIDDIIRYIEDVRVCVNIYLKPPIRIIRCSKHYNLDLTFEQGKTTICKYYLKQFNRIFELKVKTNELLVDGNTLKINYTIGEEVFNFELNYTECK